MFKLTIYGTDGCHLCDAVTDQLKKWGIGYRYIDIANDESLQEAYGWFIPVIEYQEKIWKSPFKLEEILEELSII